MSEHRARSTAAFVASLLLLATGAAAGEETAAEPLRKRPEVAAAISLLDLWVGEQMDFLELPGLSLGVIHDQELVWAKGYGFSDLEKATPALPSTIYRMGSITKLFTATAILQLRDQGKLRLDDQLTEHLPWFEIDSPFPEAPATTLRHLLTHTAGLPREAAFPAWTTHEFPTAEEVAEALPRQRAIYPPGTTYKYSNLGIALLGRVVEAVSGERYADYLARHLFEPLDMSSTTVVLGEEDASRRAVSYMRRLEDGSRDVFVDYDTGGLAPAANALSTVEDMARFASLHLRYEPAPGEPVVKGSTLREMHRAHWVYPSWEGGRGLGFAVSRRQDKTVVSHGGWVGGNRSHLLLVPDERLAVIAITNADDGDPSRFSYQAYDLVGEAITQALASPAPQPQADPEWRRYLGTYTDPWAWEYEVMILGGRLALYGHDYPPADDPEAGLIPLEPVAAHTFRQSDGELVTFELGEDGKVERIKRRSDYLFPKVERAPSAKVEVRRAAPPAAPAVENEQP